MDLYMIINYIIVTCQVITAPIHSTWFYWMILCLIFSKGKYNSLPNIIIILHWACRSLGDMIDQFHYYYIASEVPLDRESKWRKFDSFVISFYYISEIIADWYPIYIIYQTVDQTVYRKVATSACMYFNISKMLPIIHFLYNYDYCNVLKTFQQNDECIESDFWVTWSNFQYVISISTVVNYFLFFNVLKKAEYPISREQFQSLTFFEKFKYFTQYRMRISCIFSMLSGLTIVPLGLQTRDYINFNLEFLRSFFKNCSYFIVYFDRILQSNFSDSNKRLTLPPNPNENNNNYNFNNNNNSNRNSKMDPVMMINTNYNYNYNYNYNNNINNNNNNNNINNDNNNNNNRSNSIHSNNNNTKDYILYSYGETNPQSAMEEDTYHSTNYYSDSIKLLEKSYFKNHKRINSMSSASSYNYYHSSTLINNNNSSNNDNVNTNSITNINSIITNTNNINNSNSNNTSFIENYKNLLPTSQYRSSLSDKMRYSMRGYFEEDREGNNIEREREIRRRDIIGGGEEREREREEEDKKGLIYSEEIPFKSTYSMMSGMKRHSLNDYNSLYPYGITSNYNNSHRNSNNNIIGNNFLNNFINNNNNNNYKNSGSNRNSYINYNGMSMNDISMTSEPTMNTYIRSNFPFPSQSTEYDYSFDNSFDGSIETNGIYMEDNTVNNVKNVNRMLQKMSALKVSNKEIIEVSNSKKYLN